VRLKSTINMRFVACLLAVLLTLANAFDFTSLPVGSGNIPDWTALPIGASVTSTSGPAPSKKSAVYVAFNTSLTTTLPQATVNAITTSSASGLSVAMQFRIHSEPSDKPITIASIAGVTLVLQPAQILIGVGEIITIFKDDFATVRQGSMV
jgi:hypothetical protein